VQALCPQCSQKIVIDDAKVPDRPFNVRCPRCQTVVKLTGKGAAGAAPKAVAAAPAPAPVFAPPPIATMVAPAPTPPPPTPMHTAAGPDASGSHSSEEMRVHMMAQLRREMTGGEAAGAGQAALVAFPDPAQAAAITLTLTRLGYHVDTVENFEDGARLLDQGLYPLVVSARVAAAPGRPESLYQRMARLSPDQRRRVFVILVGDEFKSGDGTQAFLVLADVVLNTRDAGAADQLIRAALLERKRLYQVFDEARKRFEESGR
jgi:predicted Zn finger-like uncharacterized protein